MILFVDDEERYMDSYLQELQLSKYEVKFIKEIDKAMVFLAENFKKISLIILDIMMPPGINFKHSNNDLGLRTGVNFYKEIRKNDLNVPIIILTNVSDINLENHFRGDDKCQLLRKENVLPFELVIEVEKILKIN